MALTDFTTLSVHIMHGKAVSYTTAKFATVLLNQQQLNRSGIKKASVIQYWQCWGVEMDWSNLILCLLWQDLLIGKNKNSFFFKKKNPQETKGDMT